MGYWRNEYGVWRNVVWGTGGMSMGYWRNAVWGTGGMTVQSTGLRQTLASIWSINWSNNL